MKRSRRLSAAWFVLAVGSADADAGTRQVLMKTSGAACRDVLRESFARRTCSGPADFVVTFSDEGNLVGVEFGRRGKPFAFDGEGSVWRAADKGFGDIIEWRIGSAGKPVAAILRAWETGDGDSKVQSLKVFALGAERACLFASVPASEKRANEKAASQAERAVGWTCSGVSR